MTSNQINSHSSYYDYCNIGSTPPGPIQLPLIGVYCLLGKEHQKYTKLANKYGDIFNFNVGDHQVVVLNYFEAIKEALVEKKQHFRHRANLNLYNQFPQNTFVELKNGEPWKRHRQIIMQAMHDFAVKKGNTLETWLLEEADNLIDIFLSHKETPQDPAEYLPFASSSFMQRLTYSKRGSFDDEYLVNLTKAMADFPEGTLAQQKYEMLPGICKPLYKLFRGKAMQNFIRGGQAFDTYVSKRIEEHKKRFDPDNPKDVADGLLKASQQLTDYDRNRLGLTEQDIVNGTLIQFAGAGGELPSHILRWALLYMAAYPNIQYQVQQELDEVVGINGEPCAKHRSKLPFTDACINEILRHSAISAFPAIAHGTVNPTQVQGYTIPENTIVIVNYYSLTRDQRYWKNPEAFNPYRFLSDDGSLNNNLLDKFSPFGIGDRRCLGEYLGRLQIFVLFSRLLQKCHFKNIPGQKLSYKNKQGPFLAPKQYKLLIQERKPNSSN